VPPAEGVPDRLAVPSPLSVKVTPEGRDPDSVRLAVGIPEVVTRKLLVTPAEKVVEAEEVIFGAWSTVRVKDWVALGEIPFDAAMVIG
jgi:hypothetical protein